MDCSDTASARAAAVKIFISEISPGQRYACDPEHFALGGGLTADSGSGKPKGGKGWIQSSNCTGELLAIVLPVSAGLNAQFHVRLGAIISPNR